ncbi:helix-turn-helix domain-containing protein [Krasilnikovia sp. MM14-A1004]|uniref:winged helix-turn-helix domain-containing protein n=1 Tax=Krasilnikovia sp. MM14-A1004 TaxID=3373541 RepID=UPI00399CEAB5
MTLSDTEVALRPKEFDLLVRLAAAPGAAVSRETLMSDVWDENRLGQILLRRVRARETERGTFPSRVNRWPPQPNCTAVETWNGVAPYMRRSARRYVFAGLR